MAFAPGGRVLGLAGRDGLVRLWDPATVKALGSFRTGHAGVPILAFGPGGKVVASGAGFLVRLWPVPPPAAGAAP